jgi:hypothetical protein
MNNRINFHTIQIIEWLRPGDRRTGWELFDELEPLGIASKPEVEVKFWRVTTRDEFIERLRGLEANVGASGRIPLLHIETHGSDSGIGVSPEEGIIWADLMEELIALNRLTRLNLTVILAACEGIWGVQMSQPARRAAAFRGLIGPHRRVMPGEIAAACHAFYRTAFGANGGDAFKAMNDAVDPATETFLAISAETDFKVIFRGYLETLCTPEAIEQRLDGIMEDIRADRRSHGRGGRFVWEIAGERDAVRLSTKFGPPVISKFGPPSAVDGRSFLISPRTR